MMPAPAVSVWLPENLSGFSNLAVTTRSPILATDDSHEAGVPGLAAITEGIRTLFTRRMQPGRP